MVFTADNAPSQASQYFFVCSKDFKVGWILTWLPSSANVNPTVNFSNVFFFFFFLLKSFQEVLVEIWTKPPLRKSISIMEKQVAE